MSKDHILKTLRPSHCCEATWTAPIQRMVECEVPTFPYRLSIDAARRLLAHALRPIEWLNLAALHGPQSVYLTESFYYQVDGEAAYPQLPIDAAKEFAFPRLKEASLSRVCDIAIAWSGFEEEAIKEFARFRPESVDLELELRIATPHPEAVQNILYSIAAQVVTNPLVLERCAKLAWLQAPDNSGVFELLGKAEGPGGAIDKLLQLISRGIVRKGITAAIYANDAPTRDRAESLPRGGKENHRRLAAATTAQCG